MSNNGTIITGSLSCIHDLSVNEKLIVVGQSSLSGPSTFNGNVLCGSSVTVVGTTALSGSVSCGTSLSISGPTTCSQWLTVLGTSSHSGDMECGGALTVSNTLAVTNVSTLSGGIQIGNPETVTTGESTTMNYYKQGVFFSTTVYGGDTSVTTTCKCSRLGNIVVLTIQPFELISTAIEEFNVTASTFFTGKIPPQWVPETTVSSTAGVKWNSGDNSSLGLCEIDSSGDLTLYGNCQNLSAPQFTGTVNTQTLTFIWDLS